MSAAARPKRWGVFRQVKGQKFDPSRVDYLPYLTGRASKGTWGNLGRQKEKEMTIHKWISSDGSELVPTTDFKTYLTLPYLTLPYLTLPYLTLPYLTLPYLTLPYLTLPYSLYSPERVQFHVLCLVNVRSLRFIEKRFLRRFRSILSCSSECKILYYPPHTYTNSFLRRLNVCLCFRRSNRICTITYRSLQETI
jgi:hypothetical protein